MGLITNYCPCLLVAADPRLLGASCSTGLARQMRRQVFLDLHPSPFALLRVLYRRPVIRHSTPCGLLARTRAHVKNIPWFGPTSEQLPKIFRSFLPGGGLHRRDLIHRSVFPFCKVLRSRVSLGGLQGVVDCAHAFLGNFNALVWLHVDQACAGQFGADGDVE